MGLKYENLDEKTRSLMLEEILEDVKNNRLYISNNLSVIGKSKYSDLLKKAASQGSDDSLAADILPLLNDHEPPHKGSSGQPRKMRSNAHNMLGEGEFNRFYCRAICRRTLQEGYSSVEVYRAKQVENARSESTKKIGSSVDAQQLLDDLRTHLGVDTALGLPSGPNSGLSVRMRNRA